MEAHRQGTLLIAVMYAALLAASSGVVQRFAPAWQPGYLVGASFLVALEACLVQQTFRRERMWLGELSRYLLPEFVVMLVIMRVATTLSLGIATLAEDARRWLYDPLSIFDAPFLLAIMAGVVVGYLAHVSMRDLLSLAPHTLDTPQALQGDDQRFVATMAEDRTAALRRMSNRFIVGGVLTLFALGLEAVNIERIAGPSRVISGVSAGGALVYLMSGFLLYSQSRLALLRARWQIEGATVAPAVARRWGRASWLLIVGVAGAALLLPRTYGMGLLDTFRALLGLIGYAFAVVGYMVIWLFGLLALIPAWLLSLFSRPGEAGQPLPPPPAFAPPALPPQAAYEPQLLATALFWLCMLLLAGYALWIVLQRHPGLAQALTRRGPLAWLLRQIGWLWRDTRVWASKAAVVVQAQLRRPISLRRERRQLVRLRGLPPRELVRYFYRSTLRRAAEGGLPRRAGQTPHEYRARLAQQLPEADADLAALTEAFVAAEYGPRAVDAEQAQQARRPWERLRQQFRALLRAQE